MMHSLILAAAGEAPAKMKRVERVAEVLTKLMQEIHGGGWRIQIDHEVRLIVIAEKSERKIVPKPEVA